MARLAQGDEREVERLRAALRRPVEGAPPVLDSLLGELARTIGAVRAVAFGYYRENDGFAPELVRLHGWARPAQVRAALERRLRRPGRLVVDPAAQAPRLRDRPVRGVEVARLVDRAGTLVDDLARRFGAARCDQLYLTVHDGPAPLVCLAFLRNAPFTRREAAILAALVPALRWRLLLERRPAEGELARAALAAALELTPRAAFLLDAHGRVRHANAKGHSALEHDLDGIDAMLRAGHAGTDDGSGAELVPVTAPGLPAHYLAILPPPPSPPSSPALAQRWGLTRKQAQVLDGLLRGHANKTIANALGCGESTVEYHVTNILRKAGASGRVDLVARCLRES